MKSMIVAVLSVFSFSYVHAELLQDKVAGVLPGKFQNEEALILLAQSGRVLFSKDNELLHNLKESALRNESLSFVVDGDHALTAARNDSAVEDSDHSAILDRYYDDTLPSFSFETLPTSARYVDMNYVPTNLTSSRDAQKLMDELKMNTKSKAECYQKAHLWVIEMLQMAKIHSEKVFLFFTEKYIREYRFHWWFHVAPFVLVNDQELVLDPSFFDRPADMRTWTNFFMPTHPQCKVVDSYQDYEKQSWEEYCLLRKMPMYYYEPRDVETRDKNGSVRRGWFDWEVSAAYGTLLPWWKR